MDMRKTLTALALVALTAASFAASRARVAGSYRLVPNQDTREFCRRHRIDLPTGRLVLSDNRTFRLTFSDDEGVERTSGYYDVDGDRVMFTVETGFGVGLPRSMRIDDHGLRTSETEYELEDEVPAPVLRPREVVVPREETRSRVEPRYESGRHSGSIEGVWRLTRGQGIDGNTKFVFNSDGTFKYTGDNSSSRGRYELSDSGIELTWTEIDGQPVEKGSRIRKCLPFAFGGDAFYVDDYRYERGR
jgi:hypothetical protein